MVALPVAQVARAGDGSVPETVVWELPGRDIVASYSKDRDGGGGKMRFRDVQSRKMLNVNFLLENDKNIIADLALVGMQDFDGMFIVTLETAAGYVVQIFVFDERNSVVNEVATDGGRWLPEMIHLGDQAEPAVGLLRQPMSSKQKDPQLICGERFYVLRPRGIEKIEGKWGSRGPCTE